MVTTTEPRVDACPVCGSLFPGVGVVIFCDICGTVCYPNPEAVRSTLATDGGMVYAWNDGRWVVCVQEEDGWMPY